MMYINPDLPRDIDLVLEALFRSNDADIKQALVLRILKEDGWVTISDDGQYIALNHPYKIPRVIRMSKEERMPIGTAMAVLEAAGIRRHT